MCRAVEPVGVRRLDTAFVWFFFSTRRPKTNESGVAPHSQGPIAVPRTEILSDSSEGIARAAAAIRSGLLVAFPTETVYGLGASALDAAAARRIFEAKGRPATNPVIVHIASSADLASVVTEIPPRAQTLAERFWPGPLTLVLPRSPRVPEIVTAGGPTVAVRVPAHPAAQLLLRECGVPVAAPSANRATCLSPTRPEHVLRGLDGRIDFLLDAGPCPGGLESTVLDLTTDPPTLLRPGLAPIRRLEDVVGPIQRRPASAAIARSPGQMKRHYAPATPIEFAADDGRRRVEELIGEGCRVGWLTFGDVPSVPRVRVALLPTDPLSYAAGLFAALHQLDAAGLDRLVIALPPEDDDWLAVHDRLSRMI
jgi:L-threonylcarbamoyladenylate synthase